jgi:DNA-binding SARP family transcriptional activator
MIARARTILTGLGALGVLALAVVGLPVLLYRYGGSPLPGHLASWHRVVTVLSSRDDGTLLLAIIRDLSWLAWLLFTICVLAETQAAARGRRAPQLRLGGMQSMAARLVALAALTFAAPTAITLSSSVAAVSTQHGSAGLQPQEIMTMTAPQSAGSGNLRGSGDVQGSLDIRTAALEVAAADRLITVRSGDCLWSIAQRYLGGGDRYPEIFRLNYDHEMTNGVIFTNPSLIEPGWQLLLPAGGHAGQAADQVPGGGSQHPGHATRDSHYRRRHPAARHGAADSHAANTAGNVAGRAGAGSSARAGSGSEAAAGASSGQPADQAGFRTSAGADTAGERIPEAAVFVAGALAGAILTSLTRLRRRQRQERRRGRRIALPADPAVLGAEQRLYAAAPVEPVETLRDALACLEDGVIRTGQELPDIVGLHVTPAALEVLLSAPAADGPPAPYAISPGRQGMCWQLELPVTDGFASAGGGGHGCHLLAGLVSAGATADGYLLLDLESLQVTGCDGPPDLIDQVIATAATELAAGQWSGWYELILVGCDELEVLGRAEHCATLDEALSMLESRCAAVGHRIAERAPADVRELRLAEPDNEDWSLTILVSRVEPSAEEMMRLLALAEEGPGGIAALVSGDPETPDGRMAPTVLQLAPDPDLPGGIVANVVPLQITVRPGALSGAEYEAITTLFAVAADLDDVGQDEEPYVMYGAPPWIPQATTMQAPRVTDLLWPEGDIGAEQPGVDAGQEGAHAHRAGADQSAGFLPGPQQAANPATAGSQWHQTGGFDADPDFGRVPAPGSPLGPAAQAVAVPGGSHPGPRHAATQRLQVRILGPFAITGAAEQLQPKQAELVLALALAAPAGLSNSALCSMLGADPDHPKPTDAVRQIITRTRRRLGLASDGQEYIIHAGNGQYVLHPEASLDWSRFRELVATGRPEDLRAAVTLIGGQPFTGGYFWWIDIPLLETVRAELVDAAETLAEYELASGSARAAAKAARAGLMAEASAEQLWRAVMRAEHAAGNLAGVTEAWRRCLDAIEDIAPGGEPHPDTEALYRQLTMAARQHAPVR